MDNKAGYLPTWDTKEGRKFFVLLIINKIFGYVRVSKQK